MPFWFSARTDYAAAFPGLDGGKRGKSKRRTANKRARKARKAAR